MPHRNTQLPSFQSLPIPKDAAPRRYKDAPCTVGAGGYVLEWCPTHPKASHGVYFQHRLVMECHLGRFLTKAERVHHKNRDRADNRLDNLQVAESHSAHMKEHWHGRGKNDPALIELVRAAAGDITKNLGSLGLSPTMVQTICRENGIVWIPCGQRGRARLLTDAAVREALQGRTTAQAAQVLGLNVMTLYDRFDHLLTKRARPGFLDDHRVEILDLVYRQRVARTEVARMFSTAEGTVTKAIQRWLRQGATPDDIDGQSPIPSYRGQRPTRKAQRRAALKRARAEAPQGSQPSPQV